METRPYRVRPGAELPHGGDVLRSGADVALPPHVAYEVRHLVEPVDPATNQTRPWGAPAQEALEAEIARALPHERVSIVEAAIAEHRAAGEELQRLLAIARREASAAAVKPPSAKAESKADAPARRETK